MPEWDEEALREVNSLDAARLAIRGALSTIHNLQEQNAKLQANSQEEAGRRKILESRIAELASQIERWQEQAKRWEAQEQARLSNEASWKEAVRLELRSEEKAAMEEDHRRMDEEISRLRAQLERMISGQREKEEKWAQLQKNLEQNQAELLRAEREKMDLSQRYHKDGEMVAKLREQRDQEIAASLRRGELEVEDRQRKLEAVQRDNEDLRKQNAAAAAQIEQRLAEREEKLLREYRIKEQALHEKYSKREMDLQSSWSELENGLWKRAKDARTQLDQIAQEQFTEKSRALAERAKEIDELLAVRRQELDLEYARKMSLLEADFAQKGQGLQSGWDEKQKRFLKKCEEEISHEKAAIEVRYQERFKALALERDAHEREFARLKEELEAAHKHKASLLMEDHAHLEAQRIRAQEDFIAKKGAELETAVEARERTRVEEFLSKQRAEEDALNRRRVELLEEHEKAVAGEKEALSKQFEDRCRALDSAYETRVLEIDRARRAMEQEFKEWKASVSQDYALKERNLDKQWALREQELVKNHEAALERHRRDFALETRRMEDEFEAGRRRDQAEAHADYLRKEQETAAKHEIQVAEMRENQRQELLYRTEQSDSERLRLREELQGQINRLREELQSRTLETERLLREKDLRLKGLEEKLAEADKARRDLGETLRNREKEWEGQKMSLQEESSKREAQREQKYLGLEKTMQESWTKREAQAVEMRLKALEKQHQHYLEQIERNEERLREEFEQWKREWKEGK